MENVSTEMCNERHKSIDEKFGRQEKWLGEHETKLDKLEKSDATNTQAIKELCSKIGDLVSTIRWLIGLLVVPVLGGIIGFFFYAIQRVIFK